MVASEAESVKREVDIKWSNNLAYCVGLIASDGNLSKDGRHITFVSKDLDLIKTFNSCLNLENKISVKNSGYDRNARYYYVQFGNVMLYRWLNNVGLKPNKSKTIGILHIPNKYFFDFLRGLLDGDGCVHSFRHPESKYPQIRLRFTSGSKNFLTWLKNKIFALLSIKGKIATVPRAYELIYYKQNSIELLKLIYRRANVFLGRKFEKAKTLLIKDKGGWCNWQTREA